MAFQIITRQPIQTIWQHFYPQKANVVIKFLHSFAIPSSGRHEKCCQILERLFVVFLLPINIPCSVPVISFLSSSTSRIYMPCSTLFRPSRTSMAAGRSNLLGLPLPSLKVRKSQNVFFLYLQLHKKQETISSISALAPSTSLKSYLFQKLVLI